MIATGDFIHPVGEVTLNLTWEGVERAVKFIVLKSAASPIILGTRWSADVGAITYFDGKEQKMKCIRGAGAVQQLAKLLAEGEEEKEKVTEEETAHKEMFTGESARGETPSIPVLQAIEVPQRETETVEQRTIEAEVVEIPRIEAETCGQRIVEAEIVEQPVVQATGSVQITIEEQPAAETITESVSVPLPKRINNLWTSNRQKPLMKQNKVKVQADMRRYRSRTDAPKTARNSREVGRIRKLLRKYMGPLHIIRKRPPSSYLVEDITAERKRVQHRWQPP
jgi:hypothetical protein